MLSNAYFLAKFRFDTAENEPAKNLQIFEKCIFEKCIFRFLAGSFSAVSKRNFARKYAFDSIFKLYKICILLHRCDLRILRKICLRNQQFCENSAIFFLQMSQNLQKFAKFQKCQLDILVDLKTFCKTRICLQRSVPIQPKRSEILPKFCQKLARPHAARGGDPLRRDADEELLPALSVK